VRNYDYSKVPKRNLERSVLSKERNALIVSILIYQGIVTGEIEKIQLADLDLIKATIKIRGSRRHNERILPLKATQIGLFMHYLQNVRPQILEYHTKESNNLFLTLPEFSKKSTDKDNLDIFKRLSKQLQRTDKQFFNFKQVRASVITFWLKTQGLRKTQYLAGHKWISSTEDYLPNNLDDLTDDINKMHPF
jgi:integrase/recombinase XerD